MIPKFGQVWRHYKGGDYYNTLGVAENEKKVKVGVFQATSGNLYTHPLSSWNYVSKKLGKRRFTLVPEPSDFVKKTSPADFFLKYGKGKVGTTIPTLAQDGAKKVFDKFSSAYKTIGKIHKKISNVQSFANDDPLGEDRT